MSGHTDDDSHSGKAGKATGEQGAFIVATDDASAAAIGDAPAAETAPAKDRTGCIVFCAVLGAFLLLIGAWMFFFWVAGKNRIESVPDYRQQKANGNSSYQLTVPAGGAGFSVSATAVTPALMPERASAWVSAWALTSAPVNRNRSFSG